MRSKALWHRSAHHSEILDTPLPPDSADMLEIKTHYSLVSLGTERLVAKGAVPPELYQQMGVPFMEGQFDFPVKYGYSLVGEVVSGPRQMRGKLVHLMHPHQDRCVVPGSAVTEIPEGIPLQRACLTSNLETVLNAVWDSAVSMGDRVAVVGFGAIGALLCRLLSKIPGLELVVFEQSSTRRTLAGSLGFEVGSTDRARVAFDLMFNCSSSANGLQFCLDHTGKEGKVVELSWYGTAAVQLNLGTHFHHRRLQLISSQVSQIPPNRLARWDYSRRKQAVFKLLQHPDFDLHITHSLPFDQAPAFFEEVRKGPVEGIGYCLVY